MKNLFVASLIIAVVGALPARADQATGFYVRGDFGAAFVDPMSFANTSAADPFFRSLEIAVAHRPIGLARPALPTQDSSTPPSQHATNTFLVDGGLGWRFTPAFRIDGTFGYLAPFHFDGAQGNVAHFQGDISSFVGMANGYVDFGGLFPTAIPSWINPFVVGSIGVAVNRLGATDDEFITSPNLGPGAVRLTIPPETGSGAVHANFAWGAGAGFGIPVNERVTIDVTYKYTDLGEVRTGTSEVSLGTTLTGAPAKANLRTNTLTLGARVGF